MPHDELRESPLPPADDERIRRLLAEARHTEPMPAEVATRLDDVLAELSAQRAAHPSAGQTPVGQTPVGQTPVGQTPAAPVVELAARRRRTAVNLLVAAAAVVVLGVGISQVLPQGSMNDGGGDALSAEEPASDSDGNLDAGGGSGQESAPEEQPGKAEPVRVRSQRFGADMRRIQAQVARGALVGTDSLSNCLSVDAGAGDYVAASYDGAPAVVVLRKPSGEVQVADLYLCGDTEPRRSITLTLP